LRGVAMQEMRTAEEIEALLLNEAERDLAAESQGVLVPAGEMQRDRPEEYKAIREVAYKVGKWMVSAALSMQQAKRISTMLHSEDEGLPSIQDVLNLQPVNALTLAHLVRLERSHRARHSANMKNKRYREIEKQVRAMWASGQYKTHTVCARKACEKYPDKVSYDTAIKYLRGAPKPPRATASKS
jgi:hypothetical protein